MGLPPRHQEDPETSLSSEHSITIATMSYEYVKSVERDDYSSMLGITLTQVEMYTALDFEATHPLGVRCGTIDI